MNCRYSVIRTFLIYGAMFFGSLVLHSPATDAGDSCSDDRLDATATNVIAMSMITAWHREKYLNGTYELKTDEEILEQIREAATKDISDPLSAQFRNMEVRDNGCGVFVCGEMNSKNKFGGYDGFRKFFSPLSGDALIFLTEPKPNYPDSVREAMVANNSILRTYCD